MLCFACIRVSMLPVCQCCQCLCIVLFVFVCQCCRCLCIVLFVFVCQCCQCLCIVLFVFVCQYCRCLCIVHSWLPLRFSLAFIQIAIYAHCLMSSGSTSLLSAVTQRHFNDDRTLEKHRYVVSTLSQHGIK